MATACAKSPASAWAAASVSRNVALARRVTVTAFSAKPTASGPFRTLALVEVDNIQARLFWAGGNPASAALRYHLRASAQSLATPRPLANNPPRLHCA